MKYLIVLHSWFMDSKGFEVIEVTANSYKDADHQGAKLAHDEQKRVHTSCDYVIIELVDKEHIKPKVCGYTRNWWTGLLFGSIVSSILTFMLMN